MHLWTLIERLANLRRREAVGVNFAPVHAEILRYLSCCNRYSNTPGAVAEYLGLTKGTISQTLAVLVRRGQVSKSVDRRDRRVVHLHLTSAGRDAADALRQPAETAIGAIAADDLRHAEDVLTGLLRSLQQQHGHKTFGVCGTCRFLLPEAPGAFRCGLTREPLEPSETQLICREHEMAQIEP